jgi:hypothetical protein
MAVKNARNGWVVKVPFHSTITPECDTPLRMLEADGIKVDRSLGASAIDLIRCLLASDALDQGFESMLFVDADIAFDPADVVKIFRHPEPVVAGIYAARKMINGQINARFAPVEGKVQFGTRGGMYALEAVGAGFLRIKCDALRYMIHRLELPVCRMSNRYGWPFFLPVVVPEENETRYLTEDYAFIWRCLQVGIPVVADTTIRLAHMGAYPYMWEEAGGMAVPRYENMEADFKVPRPTVAPPVLS